VRYPGYERVATLRNRLTELRAGTVRALEETHQLRLEIEAVRREIGSLTVAVGDQLAALAAAVEDLTAAGTPPRRDDEAN
jgi:hypothetical protein